MEFWVNYNRGISPQLLAGAPIFPPTSYTLRSHMGVRGKLVEMN